MLLAIRNALRVLPVLLAACQAEAIVAGAAPSFVYHAADRLLPFPSDRFLAKDTGTRPASHESATGYHLDIAAFRDTDPALTRFPGVAESLETLDGFGTSAAIAVGLTYGPDVTALTDEATAFERSIAADSPVVLLSIDPDDPDAGKPLPFVARLETDGNVLFLTPWRPLAPAGWYAVVFKPGFRDPTGRAFVAPPGFTAALRAENGAAGELEAAGYAQLRKVYDGPIVFATTFRTASLYPKLQALVATARALAPSEVTFTTRVPGAGHWALAVIVEGWITHREFRDAHGKLQRDVVREEKLPFSLALPLTSATVHEPFPVVLAQHGFGNRRQGMLHLADAFAAQGMATLAIDAPNHGARGPGDGLEEDFFVGLQNTFGIWTDGEHLTFRAWLFRDVLRQQVLDHLQVLQAVKAWQGDVARAGNVPGADLDLDEVAYIGHSMGGVMGGVSGAVLPELKRVLLNVAGGPISEIFVANQVAGDHAVKLLRPRDIANADGWRMIAFVQSCLDPGDPINFAARIGREPFAGQAPRPLLLQNSYKDLLVPNHATFALARAVGAPLVGPYYHSSPDVAERRVPPAGLGGDGLSALALFRDLRIGGWPAVADHGSMMGSDTALAQSAPFLKTGVVYAPPAP